MTDNTLELALLGQEPVESAFSPLTEENLRTIFRDNAEFLGALIDTLPSYRLPDSEVGLLMWRVLHGEPQIASAILAMGSDWPALRPDWTDWRTTAAMRAILRLTNDSVDLTEMARILVDEIREHSAYVGGVRH